MNQPTRFGDYLLLKKLSEDPLGETYRAGKNQGGTVGEIVLLRIFNIPGIDPQPLVEALRDPRPRVQGPGLVHAVDAGAVGGVPYAAYPYAPRWELTRMIAEANIGFSDLELDYAVLIAERIAKGLAVVHQEQADGAARFHGFLIPQLIWVTGDGEIQIVGWECGPQLAAMAQLGQIDDAVRPYLSPEVLAGAPPTAQDDIYSLGAMLWELLTAKTLEPGAADNLAGSMMMARVAATEEPIPDGLGEILQHSLVSARGRVATADAWHRELSHWMGTAQLKTHFDLAFFVHELFRDPMQKEEEELAVERRIDLNAKAMPDPLATVALSSADLADAVQLAEASGTYGVPDPSGAIDPSGVHDPSGIQQGTGIYDLGGPPERSSNAAWIGMLSVLVLIAGAVLFFALRSKPAPPPPVAESSTTTAEPQAEPEPSEDLQAAYGELEKLVSEQTEEVGKGLTEEYSDHIESLRRQLAEAQRLEEEERQALLQVNTAPAESASTPAAAAKPPPPTPAAEQIAAQPSAAASSPTATQPPAVAPNPPSPTPPPVAAATPPPTEKAAVPPATAEQVAERPAPPPPPTTTSPTTTTTTAATPPPPPTTARQPVIQPPKRIRMPDPTYPVQARRLRKSATVLLRVLVGTDGRPVEVKPVSDEPLGFGFDQAATQAARRAEFEPGKVDGEPTQMWTTVVISFRP